MGDFTTSELAALPKMRLREIDVRQFIPIIMDTGI